MTRARKELVSLSDTPYYHCIGRCVRRAFLWGIDPLTGQDYSHRKQWVVDRLSVLTEVFTIDLCAYAVLNNHYHLVIHINKDRADALTAHEVIERWSRLFKLPAPVLRYQSGERLSKAEIQLVDMFIEERRKRLFDISWYMRCLNEHLARKANKEDDCKGKFWESRYQSQALLDEAGLLTCMTYVDLNPIRAGIAKTPETSEWTSIYQRIRQMNPKTRRKTTKNTPRPALLPFYTSPNDDHPSIPFKLKDYLELTDWTGRAIVDNKHGAISDHLPSILTRLNINADQWLAHMQINGDRFTHAVGNSDKIRQYARRLKRQWLHGLGISQRLFPTENPQTG